MELLENLAMLYTVQMPSQILGIHLMDLSKAQQSVKPSSVQGFQLTFQCPTLEYEWTANITKHLRKASL